MRLNVIAALRAPTMATISQKSCRSVGQPRTASSAPVSAKGKAKTECSNLIISSVVRVLASKPLPRAGKAPPARGAVDCCFACSRPASDIRLTVGP